MLSRTLRWSILVMISALPAAAQTIDHGTQERTLSLGVLYAHDSWDQYWEGTLKRTNGNIGTLTTRSATMMAGYAVTANEGLCRCAGAVLRAALNVRREK